jgi:hypothetical protein
VGERLPNWVIHDPDMSAGQQTKKIREALKIIIEMQ